jgi:hypothetical protein
MIKDTYGVQGFSIAIARELVETALQFRLVAHNGHYRGIDYCRLGHVGDEAFVLRRNYDETADTWAEPDFAHYPYVLYVSGTRRAAELEEKLASVSMLLRRDRIEP